MAEGGAEVKAERGRFTYAAEIIEAWMRHPGPDFVGDPMFDSGY